MSEFAELEARLAAVERDVAQLKRILRRAGLTRPSYKDLIGSMKDYPEFEEIVRLGRELREAQRDYAEPAE